MTVLMFLIVCSALIASLNPCTISVLVMSISSLLGKGKHPRHVGLHSLMFGIGVFATLASIGSLISLILSLLPVGIVGYIAIVAAVVIVLLGLLEVKDYFWYGKGLSFALSEATERKIHSWTKKHHSHFRGFLLGVYTSLKLSHYTVILLLATMVIGSLLKPGSLLLAPIWSFWYITPLILIAILTSSGVSSHSFLTWKEETKHSMRLSIGLLYILVGWLMFAFLSGGLKLV